MQPKKIVVICGHPDTDSFTGGVLDHYQAAAEEMGHEVVRFNLGQLQFDPILRHGYKEIQHLEPDLEHIQDAIRECDHLVIGYPNWWCTMPALLKGMFDRIWLPGFAFNLNKETKKTEKHLIGKTAHVYIVSGSYSPFKNWWLFGDFTNEIQYGILEYAGIKTEVTAFGPSEKVDDKKREEWLKTVDTQGRKGT